MNATPLIATIGVIGLGMGYYYTKIHCPDSNMERVDGECTCMEGYYADPDDENSCVALSTTEAPTNNAVLVGGRVPPCPIDTLCPKQGYFPV